MRGITSVGLMVCASTFAVADQVVLSAGKDNTMYTYSPEKGESALSNGAGSYLFAGVTQTGAKRRALVQFDIASVVPAGSTITGASLTLTLSRGNGAASTLTAHRVSAPWGEGGSHAFGNEGAGAIAATGDATWVHRLFPSSTWQHQGGDFASAVSGSCDVEEPGSFTVAGAGLIADVQSWLDNPSANFGWCIVGDESGFGTAKRFDSRTSPDVSNRPALTIEFTPPASGCVGDYNQDGGVDGADVEAFFADWEAGNAAADLNQDGGVDGGDVEFFFAAWESGC